MLFRHNTPGYIFCACSQVPYLRGERLASHAKVRGGAVAEVAEGGRQHRAGAVSTRVPDQQLAPGIAAHRREHLLKHAERKEMNNIQTDGRTN